MAGFLGRYLTLCRAHHEGAAGRFDDIIGDHRQAVDSNVAFDLQEQAVKKTEVAARDTNLYTDRLVGS
jgi:hypothetical protein